MIATVSIHSQTGDGIPYISYRHNYDWTPVVGTNIDVLWGRVEGQLWKTHAKAITNHSSSTFRGSEYPKKK